MMTTRLGRSVLVVLALALAILPGSAASAHSALIGSTPAAGSTIESLPAEVTLTFNEDLSTISPALVLLRDGQPAATLTPRVEGANLIAASPTDLAPGAYQLAYRVVSADGHPVDGTIDFTLTGSAAAAPAPSTAPSADASPSPAAADADESAAAQSTSASSDSDDGSAVPFVIGGIAVVALAAAAAVVIARRRTSAPSTTEN